MPRPFAAAAGLLLVAACRSSTPPAQEMPTRQHAVTSPQEVPDTNPPADISHGEAPIGGVFEDGSQANPLIGVQTVNVPVGGGSIFEVRLREPGDYPFVTHAFADATKGAVGVLRAVGPGAPTGPAPTH